MIDLNYYGMFYSTNNVLIARIKQFMFSQSDPVNEMPVTDAMAITYDKVINTEKYIHIVFLMTQ